MSFVEGRVFRAQTLPDLVPAERRKIYEAMVDTLAKLHRVDFRSVGLEDYGRVGGYLTRQVQRWSQQYDASKTDDLPAMDNLIKWLPDHTPEDSETTIAHGDYRLENLIFHPTEPRVLAVIDWELGTLGAPLSDLAYNCLPYYVADPTRGDVTNLDYTSYGSCAVALQSALSGLHPRILYSPVPSHVQRPVLPSGWTLRFSPQSQVLSDCCTQTLIWSPQFMPRAD
jgi:aminoglycoside phosphotransferase (APT) family kinase protein